MKNNKYINPHGEENRRKAIAQIKACEPLLILRYSSMTYVEK